METKCEACEGHGHILYEGTVETGPYTVPCRACDGSGMAASNLHPAFEKGQKWYGPAGATFTITHIAHKILIGRDENYSVRKMRINEYDGLGSKWMLTPPSERGRPDIADLDLTVTGLIVSLSEIMDTVRHIEGQEIIGGVPQRLLASALHQLDGALNELAEYAAATE